MILAEELRDLCIFHINPIFWDTDRLDDYLISWLFASSWSIWAIVLWDSAPGTEDIVQNLIEIAQFHTYEK